MFKKILSVFLCVLKLDPVFAMNGYAEKSKEYVIDNPYENIKWDEWKAYKAQLHCHTNASDGFLRIHDFVQAHYDLNYDIVALTDHGTLNKGWNVAPDIVPLMRVI